LLRDRWTCHSDYCRSYQPRARSWRFAVDEVFFNENNRLFTALGVTTAVTGEVLLDRSRPANTRIVEIIVDLRPLESDSWRRDRALREKYLDTGRFPFARLSAIQLRAAPARIVEHQRFPLTLVGDFTVHGVTRRTEWRGEGELAGDTLRGRALTQVKMSSFDIEVPSLLSLRSQDDVKLEIRFIATKVQRRNP
jgi:polyisoprenoid-binding protein YceI